MSFIVIKCTQCGATFEIDDTNRTCKCEYCGANYVKEEKILGQFNEQPQQYVDTIDVAAVDATTTAEKEYVVPSFDSQPRGKKKLFIVIALALIAAIIIGIISAYYQNLKKVEEINIENHSEYLHTHISTTINPPSYDFTTSHYLVITNKNNKKWISGTITVAFFHSDENMERTISFNVAPRKTSEYILIDGSRRLGVSYGHSTGVIFVEGKAEYK